MGNCQSVTGAQLQQGMWRISPLLCPPLHRCSPPFHLHPPTLPLRGPNHGISLNNMVYDCSWAAAGVRLVNAVHLCYFSSECVTQNGKKLKCNKGIGAGEETVRRQTLDCGVCSLFLICHGCVHFYFLWDWNTAMWRWTVDEGMTDNTLKYEKEG